MTAIERFTPDSPRGDSASAAISTTSATKISAMPATMTPAHHQTSTFATLLIQKTPTASRTTIPTIRTSRSGW